MKKRISRTKEAKEEKEERLYEEEALSVAANGSNMSSREGSKRVSKKVERFADYEPDFDESLLRVNKKAKTGAKEIVDEAADGIDEEEEGGLKSKRGRKKNIKKNQKVGEEDEEEEEKEEDEEELVYYDEDEIMESSNSNKKRKNKNSVCHQLKFSECEEAQEEGMKYLSKYLNVFEPFITSKVHQELRALHDLIEKNPRLKEVYHTDIIEPIQQPSTVINCTLRDYQLEGISWMVDRYDKAINVILADEMVSLPAALL